MRPSRFFVLTLYPLTLPAVPSYRRASDMNNDELKETAADGVGEDVGEDAWYLSDLVKALTPSEITAGAMLPCYDI